MAVNVPPPGFTYAPPVGPAGAVPDWATGPNFTFDANGYPQGFQLAPGSEAPPPGAPGPGVKLVDPVTGHHFDRWTNSDAGWVWKGGSGEKYKALGQWGPGLFTGAPPPPPPNAGGAAPPPVAGGGPQAGGAPADLIGLLSALGQAQQVPAHMGAPGPVPAGFGGHAGGGGPSAGGKRVRPGVGGVHYFV